MSQAKDIRTDRGTAAQSGAGDLALLGAVPAAFVGAEAAATPLHVGTGAAIVDKVAGAEPGPTVLTAGAVPSAIEGGEPRGTLSLTAPVVAAKEVPSAVKSDPHDAPSAHGSGTAYVPAGIAAGPDHLVVTHDNSHDNVAPAQGLAETGAIDPAATTPAGFLPGAVPVLAADAVALETIRASVATLQEAIGQLTGHLPAGPGDAAGLVLAGAHQTVSALDDHLAVLGTAAGGVLDGATATLDHVSGQIAPTIAGASHFAGEALETAVPSAAGVVDGVSDTATHLLGASSDSIAHVLSGEAAHDVGGALTGSDPVAGVATLVGLVSAADVFQLHDGGAGDHAGLVPAGGALGVADVLAEAHPADALLGVPDHHDGLLGGLTDHHDGLLGHGL